MAAQSVAVGRSLLLGSAVVRLRHGRRWNPAAEAQAIDRAHRIGQVRTVIAYRLLSRGTVEERVAELQQQKRDLVDALIGDPALGAKLTRQDLEALLDLGV
jgi:SNF2 family DNA or RNA helicase